MVNVKVSREIDGDPELIWNLINQVERFPEWMPGVVEAKIRNKKNGASGFGREQILKTETELGAGETVQKVIAWEPPHKVTWEHIRDVINGKEFNQAREIRTTLSITNDNGRITFRMIGSWQSSGISGRLMNRVMKRTVSRNFEQALKNLQKLVAESSTV